MRVICLLLIVCLSLVSAKYLPSESGTSVLLRRHLRSVDDDDSSSSDSSEDKTVEEHLKVVEENRENVLQVQKEHNDKEEEEQRKQLVKREEEERKRQEKLEKEERKRQEKIDKEERKRQENIEKENRKREEAERKQQEKHEKQERKREEKLRKHLKKLEEEALEKDLVPDSESTEVDDADESVDLGDIWKNYIYEKYGLTVTSTRLEKLSALNRYFEEELNLSTNSTKSERRQAFIKHIQDNLNNEAASANNSLRDYMQRHINAVAIQKMSQKLEKKIANLNNDSSILENVTLPWAPAAKANIDEKRTLMQSILQILNNILPSWATVGQNSSGNGSPASGISVGTGATDSSSLGTGGSVTANNATLSNANINTVSPPNDTSSGTSGTSTSVAEEGSGQAANTISGSSPNLDSSNSNAVSESGIEGSATEPEAVPTLGSDKNVTDTSNADITGSGLPSSENPTASGTTASGFDEQSTGLIDVSPSTSSVSDNGIVIDQETQEPALPQGGQPSTGSSIDTVSGNEVPIESITVETSDNIASSGAQDSSTNTDNIVSASTLHISGPSNAPSSSEPPISDITQQNSTSDVQDEVPSVSSGVVQQNTGSSGNVALVGSTSNTGSIKEIEVAPGSLESVLPTSAVNEIQDQTKYPSTITPTISPSDDVTVTGSNSVSSGSQGSNTVPNTPSVNNTASMEPETSGGTSEVSSAIPVAPSTETIAAEPTQVGSADEILTVVATGTEKPSIGFNITEADSSVITELANASTSVATQESSSGSPNVLEAGQTTEVTSVTQTAQDQFIDTDNSVLTSNNNSSTVTDTISVASPNTILDANNAETNTAGSASIPEESPIELVGVPMPANEPTVTEATVGTNITDSTATGVPEILVSDNIVQNSSNVTGTTESNIVADTLLGADRTTVSEVIVINDATEAAVKIPTNNVENSVVVEPQVVLVDPLITEVPVVQLDAEVTTSQFVSEVPNPQSNVPDVNTPANTFDIGSEPGAAIIDVQQQ